MKKQALKTIALAALIGAMVASGADAQNARPTPEQMKAVHDCAAKKGVDLPQPPAGGPPPDGAHEGHGPQSAQGDNAGAPPPPPEGGKPPAPLTDAQKAVVDACFQANGLTPPPAPPHDRPAR